MTSRLESIKGATKDDHVVSRAVVVIPVFNAPDETIACLESVVRHTPTDVRLLIIDDHGPDRRFFEHLISVRPGITHTIDVVRPDGNLGFVAACNLAFSLTPHHDVILVNSDVVVGPQWYERMVDAARSSSDIATVSVFTNNGTILSLPHRNSPCPDIVGGWSVDQAAERIATISERVRPVIPTAVGHCFLIKRLALDLVGGFDVAFGTGYGEEVDFSQRCIRMGLRHIVADDVFVFHKGSSSFTTGARPQQVAHEAIVNARYPWYSGSVQRAASDSYSALATAINRASLQLRSPSIAFDGHCFASSWAGTQQMTFELIQSVARNRPAQDFTVIFSAHASDELVAKVTAQPNVHAEIVPNIMEDHAFRFDLLVRPHQVNSTEELRWMKRVANRTVVAQLDFISFSNPTYFDSDHSWLSQRELTKLVHASVDGIAWISDYARSDALRNGVRRVTSNDAVIFCGTDPESTSAVPSRPASLSNVSVPLLTVLGVAYNHKNRLFALRVLDRLIERGIPCHLVLSGQSPRFGSSIADEEAFLDSHPLLRQHVSVLPAVTDAEREWLYAESALILYPTVSEGFGLVPFEAARAGTPTLSTRMGSLDEVLPTGIPTITSFDVDETASAVERILFEAELASSMVRELSARGDDFTWDRTGGLMLDLLDRTLIGPRNFVDSVWAEAPSTAAIHDAAYTERLARRTTAARTYERVTSNRFARFIVGRSGSRRRRLLVSAYRAIKR
jgi:GT2 family glycosyltransferase